MTDPLFRRRIPEAAALQMSIVLMNLLECQFATLEGLPARTSKSERSRQQSICDTYLRQLVDLDIPPNTRGLWGSGCPRVRDAMLALAAPTSPTPAQEADHG